jgi:hypothetical protein
MVSIVIPPLQIPEPLALQDDEGSTGLGVHRQSSQAVVLARGKSPWHTYTEERTCIPREEPAGLEGFLQWESAVPDHRHRGAAQTS